MYVCVIMERKTVYHKSSSPVLYNPSFSSSLLDSIYRSIDEEGGVKVPEEMAFYKGLTVSSRKNRLGSSFQEKGNGEVERIMDMDRRRSTEKAAATTGRKSSSAVLLNSNSNSSSSSSSDSSFWSGGLSSSESESFYGPKSTSSSSSSSWQRPKPVRTERDSKASSSQKPKKHHDHEEVFGKTAKSKALKIYAELKKAKLKQPISPGNKLASFLNSLFANTKKMPKMKTKTVSEPSGRTCDEISTVKYTKSNSTLAEYPSSASSYTRSCLSKTLAPSSGGKPGSNNNSSRKRSVRFDPVSVIVDEDSRPCGCKNLIEEDELKIHVMEENRRVAEATRKLLESYRRTKSSYDNSKDRDDDLSDDEDEDIDDGESCSSSDLFELDNLSEIGIDRYREELPVYETTHIDTNRAIASGLIP